MIEIVSGNPTDEEMAAIVAALQLCRPEPFDSAAYGSYARDKRRRTTTEIWSLADRHADLDVDELRAMAKSGRVF